MGTPRSDLSKPDDLPRSTVLGLELTGGCGGEGQGLEPPEGETPSSREPGTWTCPGQPSETGFEHLGWKKVWPASRVPKVERPREEPQATPVVPRVPRKGRPGQEGGC